MNRQEIAEIIERAGRFPAFFQAFFPAFFPATQTSDEA